MASFNLTAELNLRGPSNLNQVVSNIRRQLSTISLNLNINPSTSRGIQAVTADVRNLSAALRDAQSNAVALSTTLRGLGAATSNVARATTSLSSNLGNISGSASGTARSIKAASSEMTEFGRQSALAIRRFAAFSVATGAVFTLSRAITSAYGEFVNFNKEFVRLQQVTDSTASGLTSLSNEITRLSTSLGVSSQELLQVSVTLAQAGLSAGETKIALEALAKSALAPSFDNLNDTVEGSIALMRQFGISASDLEGSLGSVNAVAAKFAVEASDIIAAIQRTGGVFANASRGVSEGKDALNEFLAVFTSVRATTRESAETIATGLRTIFTRIQRASTIDALKQYGISLTDLEGKFVGPYEAVKRLSEGLKSLDPRDLRFSKIVEELGGFRQIGKVIPLIQQFETAQKALGVAQRGAGSLAIDAATAQEALSVRINKVREQFVGLIRDIGQSQGFQTFVDISLKLASALISVADAAKDVLPALAAITAIRGVGALGQFFGGFSGGLNRNRTRGFASGGLVPGSGNRDTVKAMLMPGEFVIRKKAVQSIGAENLAKLNRGGYAKRRKGMTGAPLIDDIPQATGSILPRPSAIEDLIRSGGGAIDIDRTIKRTIGDKAYGSARTDRERTAALQRYFRDPKRRLQDVQSAPLTSFGEALRTAIQAGQLNPRRLSIISKSQRVPGVAEYLSELFGIPTANMIFTQGGDKQPALDALRSKGPRVDRVKRFALGGRSTAGIRRGSRSRFRELTPEEIAQLSTEDMIKYAKAQARDVFSTGGAGLATSSKFIPVPQERIVPELESSLQTYLGQKGFWQEQVSPFAAPDKKIGKAKSKLSREKSLKRQASRLSDEVAARAQEWTKITSGSPIDNYLLGALKEPILSDYRSVRGGGSLAKPFHNTRLRQAVNKALDSYDDFDYSAGNIDKFVSAFAAKKFADGGLVQKFANGGKIEDKIKKNMIGKTYQFGLVGLRSGTGSPIKTSERLEPDVSVGKAPNIKQYPVTLFRSTLSSITKKEQEKTIERDISTAFGQMVEKTASTLRGVLGGSKASSNKKQQILKGSPLTSVIGTVFESALGFLGGPYIDKSEKTKSMDFPLGLGKAAKNFGIPPNIPTDATRTIGGSGKGTSQMRGQIARFITAVEGEQFTKSFEKFKQNKLLERSKVKASSAISGYRAKVFDALKNTSIKTVLSSSDIRMLASELGVGANKLNKQAMSGTGKASLSGVLTSAGKDPEEAYKKIYEKLMMVQRRAQGGGISGQDTVRALLTPGEAVIDPAMAKRIGYSKLKKMNHADKYAGGGSVSIVPGSGNGDTFGPIPLPVGSFVLRKKATQALGLNKGGVVGGPQRFAIGGTTLPARTVTPNEFNIVVPPNTVEALQEIAEALENMGVSASESARILERGGAISVNASERAYQSDLNRLRIAGASATDIYNAEQRLAQVREQNATKMRTADVFSGATGAQLQDIQTRAEAERERLLNQRRTALGGMGLSRDEVEARMADPRAQERIRQRAFETASGAPAATLSAAGIRGGDIEQYINQSIMDTRTLRQMDNQLRQTREQELRNSAAYTSASSAEQNRMMRELRSRNSEEIAERRRIAQQLRQERGLGGGTLGRVANTLQTTGALFGMGTLREDAFGTSRRRTGFTRGFNAASQGLQTAGFGLTFAGGLIGDTLGKMRGGKEGEALSAGVSAFVGTAGIGMMFGPIGALTGAIIGLKSAFDAYRQSIIDATLAEQSQKIEGSSIKLQKSFDQLGKATQPADISSNIKDAAAQLGQIATTESAKQGGLTTRAIADRGMFDVGPDLSRIERELVSSARQTNVLQSLPQIFEQGIGKGLTIAQIQASFQPEELDKLKKLFATASGDTVIASLVAKRAEMQTRKVDTTEIDATIKRMSSALFNKDVLASLMERQKTEQSVAAATAAATIEINLFDQSLNKIGSAASKAATQFEEAQRQIQMQKSVMFGGGQIQGPNRSQENILENILSYSIDEIRNLIGQIGSEFSFNPSLTREAQSSAINQKILQQELPRILAEVSAREKDTFNPQGASADVIRRKLDEVFKKFIQNPNQRRETIDRVIGKLEERLKSRKDTTIEALSQDESLLADIMKSEEKVLAVFGNLLKQSNDILEQVNAGMNEFVANLSTATDMKIEAQNLSIEAGNELAKTLGEELSLGDLNQAFDNTISMLTQKIGARGAGIPGTGTLDPATIMQRMIEREKEARDIQDQLDKEKPPVGSERFNELSESLKRAKLEASNLSKAHQKLQNDSSRAANALTKIAELRQVQESKQTSFLDLLKNVNNPEAMAEFTNEVQSFFAQMNGQGSLQNLPAAINGLERQMAVLSPERAQSVREDFIKSLQGMTGLEPNVLQSIIDNITGVSPEMRGLIGEFYKYTDIQKDAINQASNKLIEGANTAAQSLIDAGVEVRRTIFGGGQDNPREVIPVQVKNKGGMIYASKGQYVNYQPQGTDTVPAMLTPGEFVVNAKATKKHRGLLQAINSNNKVGGYSKGGVVYLADGGYVPVDTSIDSDYASLQAEITEYDNETKRLLEEPTKILEERQEDLERYQASFDRGLKTPFTSKQIERANTDIENMMRQIDTITRNREEQKGFDFNTRLAEITLRRQKEELRRVAQTGELSPEQKAQLARTDVDQPGTTFEQRQEQRESEALKKAQDFAQKEEQANQARPPVSASVSPTNPLQDMRDRRKQEFLAEKQRRREIFLANNPQYQEREDKKQSRIEQEEDEARRWFLASRTMSDGKWDGPRAQGGARSIPNDVVALYRKNKATQKKQEGRERLLYGEVVDPKDPEASDKKRMAAEATPEEVALEMKKRRGEELARKFGWSLPTTKPVGTVVGRYEGYEPGEEPFELRDLNEEDRKALDDYQMTRVATVERAERERAKAESAAASEAAWTQTKADINTQVEAERKKKEAEEAIVLAERQKQTQYIPKTPEQSKLELDAAVSKRLEEEKLKDQAAAAARKKDDEQKKEEQQRLLDERIQTIADSVQIDPVTGSIVNTDPAALQAEISKLEAREQQELAKLREFYAKEPSKVLTPEQHYARFSDTDDKLKELRIVAQGITRARTSFDTRRSAEIAETEEEYQRFKAIAEGRKRGTIAGRDAEEYARLSLIRGVKPGNINALVGDIVAAERSIREESFGQKGRVALEKAEREDFDIRLAKEKETTLYNEAASEIGTLAGKGVTNLTGSEDLGNAVGSAVGYGLQLTAPEQLALEVLGGGALKQAGGLFAKFLPKSKTILPRPLAGKFSPEQQFANIARGEGVFPQLGVNADEVFAPSGQFTKPVQFIKSQADIPQGMPSLYKKSVPTGQVDDIAAAATKGKEDRMAMDLLDNRDIITRNIEATAAERGITGQQLIEELKQLFANEFPATTTPATQAATASARQATTASARQAATELAARETTEQAAESVVSATTKPRSPTKFSPQTRPLTEKAGIEPSKIDEISSAAEARALQKQAARQAKDVATKSGTGSSKTGGRKIYEITEDMGPITAKDRASAVKEVTKAQKAQKVAGKKTTPLQDPNRPATVQDLVEMEKKQSQKNSIGRAVRLGGRAVFAGGAATATGYIDPIASLEFITSGMDNAALDEYERKRAVIRTPKMKQYGGLIYASKGTLVPYQPRGTDTVPAMLTPGEFVVNRKSAKQNMGLLKAINNGHNIKPLGFNKGGIVPTQYYEVGGGVTASSSGGGGVSSISVDASALDAAINNFGSYVSSLSSVIDGFTQGTTELAGLSQAIGSLGNLGLREGAALMANAGISVKDATTAFSSAMTQFNSSATSLATAISSIPKSISLTVSGSIPVTVSVTIEGGGGTVDTAQLEQSIMDKVATAINSATQGGINIDTAIA